MKRLSLRIHWPVLIFIILCMCVCMNCLFALYWFIFVYFYKHKGKNKHWLQSQIVTPWWPTRWFFRFPTPNISIVSGLYCLRSHTFSAMCVTDCDHCDSWYNTKEETPCCKQVNLLLVSHYYSSWNKAQSRLEPSDQVCFFVVGFFRPPIASLWHPFLDSGRCRWT